MVLSTLAGRTCYDHGAGVEYRLLHKSLLFRLAEKVDCPVFEHNPPTSELVVTNMPLIN